MTLPYLENFQHFINCFTSVICLCQLYLSSKLIVKMFQCSFYNDRSVSPHN